MLATAAAREYNMLMTNLFVPITIVRKEGDLYCNRVNI